MGSSKQKRRTSRRRLAAHTRGDDRHDKGAAWKNKRDRLGEEKRKRKPWEVIALASVEAISSTPEK